MSDVPTARLTRRTVLLSTAASAAGLVIAGCSSDDGSTGTPTASATPSEPATAAPADNDDGGDDGGSGKKAKGTDNAGDDVGSATSPLPKPASFSEAPMLKAQVDAGKLPKLEDRLPDNPYVLPHKWVTRGKYGGDLKLIINSTSDDSSVAEWFYGFSLLRYLNDGRDLGPGIVEKWSSNKDTSKWTFTLRKGLKWSDGHPCTTDDILFWWRDLILYDGFPLSPPEECKSGKGTVCKLEAQDKQTFTMTFDAPAPLTAERIAMWSNGYGGNGPVWIVPAHFVKKYHGKYNSKLPKDWAATTFPNKCSFRLNPECPTLTGFRLSKYNDGKSLVWERNPFYYEVSKEGDQLPYIDGVTMTAMSDPQVGKLQVTQGNVDFCHGAFSNVGPADVSTLMKGADQAGIEVLLWDSGSGTGSIMFLSQDYYEDKYRKLFRTPKFRQALSLAFNRAEARTAIYFNQGEPTTGTASPKAIEYHFSKQGENMYKSWRDSFVKYDPEQAKKMFDELGLKDSDGDGFREFPDGSKLQIRLDLQADAGDEHKQKDARLVRDWKAVGINTRINPVPPTSFGDEWNAGKYMSNSNWEASDGPNQLLNPTWLVPLESSRWAPLQGAMYNTIGTKAFTSERDVDPWKRKPPRIMPEKGGPIDQLWKIYNKSKTEVDELKRHQLVFQITKVHIKYGPFFQGTVANSPRVEVINKELQNVPRRQNLALNGYVNTWIHPVPAAYDPEAYYWNEPDKHKI